MTCPVLKIITTDNFKFTFFAVHPPPPSPTEEENLKSVMENFEYRKIKQTSIPVS
jgi:hypothetical protein